MIEEDINRELKEMPYIIEDVLREVSFYWADKISRDQLGKVLDEIYIEFHQTVMDNPPSSRNLDRKWWRSQRYEE